MASSKEIKLQIDSVKKTQKITHTMQMIATSKMHKAQKRMQRARPYTKKIRQIINHIAHSNPEYHHPYMQQREVKRAAYIIVSSDRGLCGGLNVKLFKEVVTTIKRDRQQNIDVSFCPIGAKAENFLRRYGATIMSHAAHLGDKPEAEELMNVVSVLLNAYQSRTIDSLAICANQFVNTMIQRPVIVPLLPIVADEEVSHGDHWDYIYEPDNACQILTTLLSRYIKAQVYQLVIENIACEQVARMIAMKNATDNTTKMIDDLKLIYNKARQAGITRELAEIIAGAAAV